MRLKRTEYGYTDGVYEYIRVFKTTCYVWRVERLGRKLGSVSMLKDAKRLVEIDRKRRGAER